jgi:deazaflavin-dependent oxidoreductase (nitroreductase family)
MATTAKAMSKGEQRATQLFGKTFGGGHAWLYRISGGKLGARFMGAPVMLLTTRGRKSGEQRTTPLLYLRDGDKVVTVASKGGYPKHPGWYLNLQANPAVEVQIGDERRTMHAETASAEQKARFWPRLIALYPGYQGYQERTERDIPVVILRPA